MAKSYVKATPDVLGMVEEIMGEHHQELVEAGVTVEVLMAHSDKPFPVKLHGYPCCAIIKANSYKDRVEGKQDATIIVDGDKWPEWDDGRRRAIIDHEVYHLKLKMTKEGEVDRDDLGRPKLKLRLHDWELGGFAAIVERHGDAAVEAQAVRATMERHGQLLWDFAEVGRDKGKKKRVAQPTLAAASAN